VKGKSRFGEGCEDCVNHLKCQCYGGLTACVFRLHGTAYQKIMLSHSIHIFVIYFVWYSDDNDDLALGKKIKKLFEIKVLHEMFGSSV
jgi:hypothetical protein